MAQSLSASQQRLVRVAVNPWAWLSLGLALVGLAFLWSRLFEEEFTAIRVILVALGVLSAGAALAIRLQTASPSLPELLPYQWRDRLLLLMAISFATLVLAVVWLLCASWMNLDIPWAFDTVLIINILVVPVAGTLAYLCFAARTREREFTRGHEAAALLILAAVCCVVGGWALYLDYRHETDWDTMRTCLGGLALFALVGAILALLTKGLRRFAVSVLILAHFTGIVTAALRVPPTPWIVSQSYVRVFRPYLQFMWLVNAYQFYAPDPAPSNFLWFRLEYEGPKGEKYTRWEKFPQLVVRGDRENPTTEPGVANYPTGIQFQRRVAMVDQVCQIDANYPPEYVAVVTEEVVAKPGGGEEKRQNVKRIKNPIYRYRELLNDPRPVLGAPINNVPILIQEGIPLHPTVMPWIKQYHKPNADAKRLLESCARYLSRQPHPDHPEAKFVAVRIYTVVHQWPSTGMVRNGIMDSPVNYQPYYMGRYNAEGQLLDAPIYSSDGNYVSGDPMLYWLIPITVQDVNGDVTRQPIFGYVFRHAGDQRWVMYPGTKYWQEKQADGH
jgi:hypothetical protein